MNWFSSIFKPRVKVHRRVLNPQALHALLITTTSGLRSSNHAFRLSDRDYATVTRAEVESIARKVWKPWVRDVADCDDQALTLVVACREAAFAEGGHIPWGVGLIFTAGENAHAYTWALTIDTLGKAQVEFYDQTASNWVQPLHLDTPITLTLG